MQGSAIRRIGYERWLRNLAVGLGMLLHLPKSLRPCGPGDESSSELVKEHIDWALARHERLAA